MREKPILVREPRMPVPTINRLPTRYERRHRDKDRVQLWVAIALVVGPIAIAWSVL